MDDAQFDGLVRRLCTSGSRRPVIGAGLAALVALGASAARPDAGAARKKKKKKGKKKKGNTGATTTPAPQCTSCPACQACANGACAPVADGTACGSGGTCIHGGCATQCGAPNYTCPFPASGCALLNGPDAPGTCFQVPTNVCGAPQCGSHADCPTGSVCAGFGDCPPDPNTPRFICVKVLGG